MWQFFFLCSKHQTPAVRNLNMNNFAIVWMEDERTEILL